MQFNRIILASAAALTLTTSPALATHREAHSVKVEYKDLDLGTEEGREHLDYRLMAAVHEVCDYAAHHDFVSRDDSRQCQAEATTGIESQRVAIMAAWERKHGFAVADDGAPLKE